MITLITGLPGNGKTLFMLWYIKAKAEKENREVFYNGINITDKDALPWTEFEAEEWYKLPKGAIILMDEAQFKFPRMGNGAKLPDHYTKLAIHRHSGYDIFVTTQHPKLIDNFVRELVGQHFHCVRKFGLERSTIYEWSVCNPAPQSANSQKSSISLKWAFKKEVYGWYKSAEVHTVRKGIPPKLLLACLFVVAAVGFAGWKLSHPVSKVKVDPVPAAASVAPGQTVVGSPAPGPAGQRDGSADPVADLKSYVWRETPRVAGLPQTAPKYDQLTVPTRVPVPAMCVQIGTAQSEKGVRCKCWSQQSTPMDVPFNMCLEFARNGFFRDFDADKDRAQVARADSSVEALSNRPESAVPVRQVQDGPAVVVMPGEPMGPARTEKSAPLQGTIQNGPPNNRATRAAAGNQVAGL